MLYAELRLAPSRRVVLTVTGQAFDAGAATSLTTQPVTGWRCD